MYTSIQAYILFFSTINFIMFFINISMMMHTNRLRNELVRALMIKKEDNVIRMSGRRTKFWRPK